MLCEFAARFPKGGKSNTKKRMPNNFFLTSYMELKGTRSAKKQRSARAKMDYEAFVYAMESRRKWKPQRAGAVWREPLPITLTTAGLPPHGKRLRILAHLLCEDWSESEVENFQEKHRRTQSKSVRNMDAEAIAQIDAEMSCGFSSLASASAISTRGTLTFQTETTSSEGFLTVLTEAAEASGAIQPAKAMPKDAAVGASTSGPGPHTASTITAGPSPTKPAGPFDVRSSRLALIRETTKKVAGIEKKVIDAAARATASMDTYHALKEAHKFDTDDEFMACGECVVTAMLWLNKQAAITTEKVGGEERKRRDYINMVDLSPRETLESKERSGHPTHQ